MQDTGQLALEMDVKVLLSNTIDGNFHDFASEVSATPKLLLIKKLEELVENAKNGKYDNKWQNND